MKKYLFIIGCLFSYITMAQTSPLAPQSYQSKVKNSTILYKAIGMVNIPVYLANNRDAHIQYSWYNTDISWGSTVRTSEEPIRIEEGIYVNGRLTEYKRKGYLYKFHWSYDGVINSISKYDSYGNDRGRTALSGLNWVDYKTIRSKGKGGSSPSSITISNVLLYDELASKDILRLMGYCISSGWLCKKCISKELTKKKGQLVKGWKDYSWMNNIVKINSDGSFEGNECFDFSNTEKCSYSEF